jgi:hypothetical protein
VYTETGRPSMLVPLSFYSKEQETSFINRNTAMFGHSLISGRRIIGENHHVSPGEPEIRSTSTTHLEEVEGKKIGLVTNHLFINLHVNSFFFIKIALFLCLALRNHSIFYAEDLSENVNRNNIGVLNTGIVYNI